MSDIFELHSQLANDSVWLADWPLCQLRVVNDRNYPWFILVPRRNGVRDVIDLADNDQQQLWFESSQLSHYLRADYQPDKLNLAALGNMVPQLHLHHIARFQTDCSWPAPVWGKVPAQPHTAAELADLQQRWSSRLPVLRSAYVGG
jgi:diadenosine tetraphosphate (Ap4A) HIT family hydrolase